MSGILWAYAWIQAYAWTEVRYSVKMPGIFRDNFPLVSIYLEFIYSWHILGIFQAGPGFGSDVLKMQKCPKYSHNMLVKCLVGR